MAPQGDGARPAGAEADASTSTAASASTCASQATLMIPASLLVADESGQPVMDRRAFVIGSLAVLAAPLVASPRVQPDPPVRALFLAIIGGGGPVNLVLFGDFDHRQRTPTSPDDGVVGRAVGP